MKTPTLTMTGVFGSVLMVSLLVYGGVEEGQLVISGIRMTADATEAVQPQQWLALSHFRWLEKQAEESSRTVLGPVRGGGGPAKVFREVAPAVVAIRTDYNFGTGFLVKTPGWVITNHHVIALADPGDDGVQEVLVNFGSMDETGMRLRDEGYAAVVYRSDPELDLALLKLVEPPTDSKRSPIRLAQKAPAPGEMAVAIGHPAAGVPWSVRRCLVTGAGLWPQDLSENRLSGGADSPPQGAEGLRKVIFSDCALNPGDSGGPLLDENGWLIAVSFGGPAAQDLAKFSYHVHLDEVRGFLSDFPAEPQAFHIEAWPPAGFCQLVDLDQDERFETALFSVSQGGDLSGFLFDLDQDSKTKSCEELARGKEWDFEFAYHTTVASPFTQAFYDRDNDGSIDAIRRDADNDGAADLVLVRNKDRWKVAHTEDREVIRTDSFTDDELQKKLEEYLGLLHSALAGGGG